MNHPLKTSAGPAQPMSSERGDYTLVRDLQALLTRPYEDQEGALAAQSDQKRPMRFEALGGITHYSCSS